MTLNEMEQTGGETTGEFIFCDSVESPKGSRSLCYDN